MPNHIEHMAKRLEGDPFFLACPLMLYQRCEGITDEELAGRLICSAESLTSVRLCRAPTKDESFHQAIEGIAAKFSVNADALAKAVRCGQALFSMQGSQMEVGTLLAARDDDRGNKAKEGKER